MLAMFGYIALIALLWVGVYRLYPRLRPPIQVGILVVGFVAGTLILGVLSIARGIYDVHNPSAVAELSRWVWMVHGSVGTGSPEVLIGGAFCGGIGLVLLGLVLGAQVVRRLR